MTATLLDALHDTVAARPDEVALRTRDGAVRWTWSEYDALARRAASGLAGLGVGHGSVVALMLENRPEFHIADLGAVLLGAATVSIYNTSSPEQIAYVLRDSGATVLIVQESFAAVAAAPAAAAGCRVVVLDGPGPEGAVGWDVLLAAEPLAAPAAVTPDDLLTIIYTSGTTGPPKGVELTHRNLVSAKPHRRHGVRAAARGPRGVLAAAGPHRRAGRVVLHGHPVRPRRHDVREPAGDRRGAARGAPALVLRGAPDLGEAQGGGGGGGRGQGAAGARARGGRRRSPTGPRPPGSPRPGSRCPPSSRPG